MSIQQDLYVKLSHQLKSYRNAAVLYALLEAAADEREFKKSVPMLSFENLRESLSAKQARNAIDDLVALGLVSTRVYPNLKTYFTVNRDAVLDLLAKPLPDTLPGTRDNNFPFLAVWKERTERLAAESEPVFSTDNL
jgi:hypothetical protein